jgi:CheY-like chemotaxis protein/anti-sigma regulatory factor (Ser/Thr protein kinase)
LANLVSNAIKFTQQGEVGLRVGVERPDGEAPQLHFVVHDTGIGIPAEKQQAIFEPFTQVDASTTRKHGGTGLGLTISARLVAAMGGKIWVESAVNCGTRMHFTVRLEAAQPSAKPSHGSGENLRGAKVLIVDDNPANRRILQSLLYQWGLNISAAASGEEALANLLTAHAEGAPYAVLVTDLHMPGMDGLALCERVRRQPELTVTLIMMLTAAGRQSEAERCKELGVNTCLQKPIRQCELRQAILGALREASAKLPVPPPPSVSQESATPCRSLRVLLAEDNAVNQQLACRILQKRGHHTHVVGDGSAALDALEQDKYDVVLMDLQMPEMDGLEAVAAIREKEQGTGAHQVVIALTAHALKDDGERCLAAGMDGYLAKPFRAQELYALLERYTSRCSSARPESA